MRVHIIAALAVSFCLATSAGADTNIVFEDFDSYVDQAALEAVWRPDSGTGYNPVAGPNGILVPNTGIGLIPPNDDPPGIQGQGVNIYRGINEYDNDNNPATEPFQLVPSSTQSVQFSADIFDDAVGNKQLSVGLRNDTVQRAFGVFGYNFIELGHINYSDVVDPTDGVTPIPPTSFAYRLTLFDSSTIGAPLIQTPNWQYFQLDPVLDTKDSSAQPNPDGLVTPTDIGVGWHRYTATISTTQVTLELDLFRDGLKNSEATAGVGTAGVDASVTWTIAPTNINTGDGLDFDPFTSLRFGSPSGLQTNLKEGVVDNISLDLVDVPVGVGADFNASGIVEGFDFLRWQRGFQLTGQTDNSNGDADGSGTVDGVDLTAWEAQFGGPPTPLSAGTAAAVPEPTSLALVLLNVGMIAVASRSRRCRAMR
ncbi:MAG: hypothetical protein KDA57_01570 [Planctomycetales bacterium]|nr:hypothetical protein [Planctomycetales bacterium]